MTHVTCERPDGATASWSSRVAPQARVEALAARARRCLVGAAARVVVDRRPVRDRLDVLPRRRRSPASSSSSASGADGMVFFVGSIFFTSAAALQWLETINADPGPALRRGTLRVLTFEPRRIDWWSSGVQLVGTVFFNVRPSTRCRTASTPALRPPRLEARRARLGLLPRRRATSPTSRSPATRSGRASATLEWKIAAVNLVGCIAFGISAIASFWVPDSGGVLALAASNWFTALGGLCFLVGAVLLLPESAAAESRGVRRSGVVRSPVMSEATVAAGPRRARAGLQAPARRQDRVLDRRARPAADRAQPAGRERPRLAERALGLGQGDLAGSTSSSAASSRASRRC